MMAVNMSIKEKAEQYTNQRLGAWRDIIHSGYSISGCTNGEVSVQDYTAGYDFAMSQPKHIFDGAAVAGEVRRFDGELVYVVVNDTKNSCIGCCLDYCADTIACQHNTGCDINNVKYIKR